MIKVSCVIVNYNDAKTVKKLLEHIRGYDLLERIVVVDNASTDDSPEILKAEQDEKVVVISAGKNGGYGSGNNLGVRYCMDDIGASHVILANPDVLFSETCIRNMLHVFAEHPDVGVVAASMKNPGGTISRNCFRLHGFFGELLAMGPVSRRLFRPLLEYPEKYFGDKAAVFVDGVHGSMLMVDTAAFQECGGYDEDMFLYQEEAVLAVKMKTSGCRTVLLLNTTYFHEHSVSIKKTYRDLMARQRLRHESVMHYFKHYLHINKMQEWIAKLWFRGIMLEIRLAGWMFEK